MLYLEKGNYQKQIVLMAPWEMLQWVMSYAQ